MTKGDWFHVLAGAASVGGLLLGAILGLVPWRQNRATTTLIADGHAATQLTLKDVHGAMQETVKGMPVATQDTLRALGEGQTALGQILDRMDLAAEARHGDIVTRLTRREETP